jgi:hypothetical protein
MKFRVTVAALVIMTYAVAAGSSPIAARSLAGSGYSSRFAGESAFTSKVAGETGQLVAIFFNDGTTTWLPGVVGLLVCSSDHETCGTGSANTGYEHHWYSASVYATVSAAVPPGQNGFFSYEIAVPQGTPPGVSALFSGDVGLIASGVMLHPDGYFHVNTTPVGGTARLVATFRALPIPATEGTATVLGVDLLSAAGEHVVTDSTTVITATRDAADDDVCVLAGTGVAAAVEGHAEFRVEAAGAAGFCHITLTAAGGLRATAILETRHGGTPTRLTVSGTSSPQPAGAGAPIMVAVDIDDVYVQLVEWDETTSVHLALDATTCTGAAAGDVYAPSGFDVPAMHGRAWFVLRSSGTYPACRGTVTAPGLIGSTFVVTFAPGP